MASSAKDIQLRELMDTVSQLKTMMAEQTELIRLNNPGGNPSPVRRMEITNPFYWKSRFR